MSPLMWSILGVGRAGRARARALAADPRSAVTFGWRGDPEAAGLSPAESLEHALAVADAVAVCAADAAHPELVEAALRAGRHVVCEYPLASTASEARRLHDLAAARQLVLHVEHIELLGGPARWWRAHPVEGLSAGSVRFTSSRVGQSPVLGNLARLHRVLDILGTPDTVRVDERSDVRLTGVLGYGAVDVELDFQFGPGLPRETRLQMSTEHGSIVQTATQVLADGVPQELPEVGGLFATDQLNATAQILDGASPYVSWERILQGLHLVEALESAPLGTLRRFDPSPTSTRP